MKEQILAQAAELLNEKGISFTLAELSSTLKMSKKTLYKYFKSKDDLLLELIDALFLKLRSEKNAFIESDLPLFEQLRCVLKHHPDFLGLHNHALQDIQYNYPNLHRRIITNIQSEWDETLNLMNTCILKNVIKATDLQLLQFTLTALYEKRVNDEGHFTMNQLNDCIDWILEGVKL